VPVDLSGQPQTITTSSRRSLAKTVTWYRKITNTQHSTRWTCMCGWPAASQEHLQPRVCVRSRDDQGRRTSCVQRQQLRLTLAQHRMEHISGLSLLVAVVVVDDDVLAMVPSSKRIPGTAGAARACGACGASRGSATC